MAGGRRGEQRVGVRACAVRGGGLGGGPLRVDAPATGRQQPGALADCPLGLSALSPSRQDCFAQWC